MKWRDMKDYEKLEWLFSKCYLLIALALIAIVVLIVAYGSFHKAENTIYAPDPKIVANDSLTPAETMSDGDYAIFLHLFHQNDELE